MKVNRSLRLQVMASELRTAFPPLGHILEYLGMAYDMGFSDAAEDRKENSMVKHHGKPAPPRKPQPKKPPKF